MNAINHGGKSEPAAWRTVLWAGIGALLLLPMVAMQFTREVAWDGMDFLAAAVLLAGVGASIELAVRLVDRSMLRTLIIAGVVMVATLIWADAAVGIF